jgi:xylulokinase
MMASPVPSGTRIGRVTANAAAATGLPEGAAVAAGGQDHVSGALAAGVVRRGQMLDSIGTAEAVFLSLDEPLSDPALGHQGYTQGAHVAAGRYYVYGGLYTSGASIEWLRHVIEHDVDHAGLLRDAGATPVGSLGVTFLPHLRLGNAPHADPRARAAFVGITSDVDRGAMARAVLEGVAYEARNSLEPLLAFAGLDRAPEIVVIGGGSKNELLLEIKASVFGAPLNVPDLDEATALGAAMLAGIAGGVYRDVDDALAQVTASRVTVDPDPAATEFYDRYFREVFRGLYMALRPLNHAIHELVIGEAEPGA